MGFFTKVGAFLKRYVYNASWRCNGCGKEIFSEAFFCEGCEKSLPRNGDVVCNHCGRRVAEHEEYCSTCKSNLISLDKCRSVFSYDGVIKKLVRKAKYDGKKYILDYFADELKKLFVKLAWTPDFLVAVPMTVKALRKRGYNQSLVLTQSLSSKTGVAILDCLSKVKETPNQAKLKRAERIKNLNGVIRVTDKKAVMGKSLLIVDDVTTTGSTAEVIASRLKHAGARQVFLLTVASVPPKDGY